MTLVSPLKTHVKSTLAGHLHGDGSGYARVFGTKIAISVGATTTSRKVAIPSGSTGIVFAAALGILLVDGGVVSSPYTVLSGDKYIQIRASSPAFDATDDYPVTLDGSAFSTWHLTSIEGAAQGATYWQDVDGNNILDVDGNPIEVIG